MGGGGGRDSFRWNENTEFSFHTFNILILYLRPSRLDETNFDGFVAHVFFKLSDFQGSDFEKESEN